MKQFLRFDFSHFRGDFLGGLTAGVVALPLALAFGAQTELGAIAGLYGAIALGLLAALFGGTPVQISGPTAPMTVVSVGIIADAVRLAGTLESALPSIVAIFLFAGLFQIVLGLLGVGKYIRFIPYPVISGFMSGIGVIIIITQIFPLLGASAPEGGPLGTLRSLSNLPELFQTKAFLLSLLSVAIIYLFPKVSKKFPSTLVALLVVSTLCYFFYETGDVQKINSSGPIPSGLPSLHLNVISAFDSFPEIGRILQYAITLAFLGAIDSLLTSIVADNLTKTKHDSSQELIGQGLGNMLSGLIAGLPGAGATMRTVINVRSGGRTKISGVIAALFLLAVLLGLGQLVGHVPNAVLAAILLTVGIGILDYRGLRYLKSVPRSDAVVMILVLLLTVFVDLLVAVAVGMLLASLLFMKNISDVIERQTTSGNLKNFSPEVPWEDEKDLVENFGESVYIKHLGGALFFGFASRFQDMFQALPQVKLVILRMDKVSYLDQSGLIALEEAHRDLESRGIALALVGLQGQVDLMLRRARFIPHALQEEHTFVDMQACLTWLKTKFAP